MMKTTLICNFVVIMSVAPVLAQQKAAEKSAAPIIKVENPAHAFGTTWIGSTVDHKFTISNAGGAPLEITNVQPNCSCIKASAYPREIAPGESGDISFSLDTTRFHGPFSETITIYSNDPANAQLMLRLSGEAKQRIDVKPLNAGFGKLVGNEPREQIVTITNNSDIPLEASLAPIPEGAKFRYDLIETQAGHEFKLFVSTLPPYNMSVIRENVTIKTNAPGQTSIVVTASAIMPALLEVVPMRIQVEDTAQTGSPPVARTEVLQFSNYTDKPVEIVEATCNDPNIPVTLTEIHRGKRYRILVKLPAGFVPPPEGNYVSLKTTANYSPLIRVPIQVALKPGTIAPFASSATKPPPAKRPAELMEGKEAPTFLATTTTGEKVSNDEFKGYPATVLNFVAPNCGFCKKQLPKVESVRAEYEKLGVRFVNMSQTLHETFSKEDALSAYAGIGSNLAVAIDANNSIGRSFQVTSFPTLFVVDSNGKIVFVKMGSKANIDEMLRKALDDMLKSPGGAPDTSKKETPKSDASAQSSGDKNS